MPHVGRPIIVLAVVACGYGQAAERQPAPRASQEQRTESFLGSIAPVARSIHNERGFPLAYENRGNLPFADWRRKGRAEVERTLSYAPKAVPLDVRVHATFPRAGYEVRRISFAASAHYRVPAYLLVPTSGKAPYPAVVALHDHGGWFYHGKEKLVAAEGEHAALKGFRERLYGGRTFADELAKRGFVVIVPDALYWGERRMQYEQPPPELAKRLAGLKPEQPEYVLATNTYLSERVRDLNTQLAYAGTSWLGIVNHDDRQSVAVLAAMPEVDAARLGCVGLSGGGHRATYLAATEPRLRASVIVGWMTSLPTTLDIAYSVHSGMLDAFGLHANLDHPDVASLAAPDNAVFVQNCARDRLFTRAGMEAAALKIQKVYQSLGRPDKYRSKFYDAPHQFNVEMQDDAFEWLELWLRRPSQSTTGAPQPDGATPFGGAPQPIPGTVELENFDEGPEGVAFHDVEAANDPKRIAYRTTAVDLEVTPDQKIVLIGHIKTGEWWKYAVDVAKSGTYQLELGVSVMGVEPPDIRIEFDGVDVSGPIQPAPTSQGWHLFTQILGPMVTLKSGIQVMRVVVANSPKGTSLNLDYVRFVAKREPSKG